MSLSLVAELFCFRKRAMGTVIDCNVTGLGKLYTKGDDE
jgi:hypothetical protein